MVGCHTKAGCGEAFDRGLFGWICDPCWTVVQRVLDKILRRVP